MCSKGLFITYIHREGIIDTVDIIDSSPNYNFIWANERCICVTRICYKRALG